ncbi:hypothetical protein C8N25_104209 [Algoriphagus antarcticus]|uniref:Uncharacterized protein n=1 Tax=Algoriphagus antarcticus TaxID=238540 RepID=A0A3E0E082_9BACT|nr:hypothetical protein C8N25_104209 [Algoriphagus antarcticus]
MKSSETKASNNEMIIRNARFYRIKFGTSYKTYKNQIINT